MSRLFRTITIVFCFLALPFHSSLAEDPMDRALNLMRRNLHEQAIPILTQMVMDDPMNSRARFQLGICFLNIENYRRAYEAFSTAAEITPDHRFLAGERYRQAGVEKLNLGQIAKVDHLFRKAAEFQPHLKARIAQLCHARAIDFLGQKDIGRPAILFALAAEFEPGYKPLVLKTLLEAGDAANDELCIGYYNLAADYCTEDCSEGRDAGLRLQAIANRLENADVLDQKIDVYREIGRKFVYIPQSTEYIGPGRHMFNLAPDETTPWLAFPPGLRVNFIIQATDNHFEAILGDGSIIRYWENEKLPDFDELPDARIKFRATAKTTVIGLTVQEIQ